MVTPILSLGGLLVALLAALAPAPPGPRPDAPGTVGHARLDVVPEGGGLTVQALFVSDAGFDGPLHYTLEVTKGGRSRSTSRQSGRFTAAPGDTVALATSRVSAAEGDAVTVVLTILDGTRVLDTARFPTSTAP